jgi:hypothetical protein
MINYRLHRFKLITLIAFFATLYSLLSTFACAQPISSTDLIKNAKQYDGKVITYQGEIIGDIMVRGEFAWINVNDGKNAIGAWIDKNLTKDILYTGSYKTKGDWIEVTGIFQRACLEHGGDLDIHAKAMKILEKGSLSEKQIPPLKIKLIIAFMAICLVLTIIYFIKLGYGKRS